MPYVQYTAKLIPEKTFADLLIYIYIYIYISIQSFVDDLAS